MPKTEGAVVLHGLPKPKPQLAKPGPIDTTTPEFHKKTIEEGERRLREQSSGTDVARGR
jgi:hypothetical protein